MSANGGGPLADAEARRRIRDDHDITLIVEAAAGTGKTTSVTERIVAMVATGTARIGEIAAITFTEKAAGELRLRIRQGIEARIEQEDDPEPRARLEKALAQLEEASIGTIHAFCGEILRERPIEAGVDPDFQILSGQEREALIERVFQAFLRQQLAKPGPGISRLLRRSRDSRENPLDILRRAAGLLLDYRRLDAPWSRRGWDGEEAVRRTIGEDPPEIADPGKEEPTAWPTLFEIERLYRAFPEPTADARVNWLRFSMAGAEALAREIRVRRAIDAVDSEWVEQALASLSVQQYSGPPPPDRPCAEKWRDDFRERLEWFQKESNADLAALLREDLRGLVRGYQEAKQKAGQLDFDDLLDLVRDLLAENAEVRAELRSRFRQILVDEYQDTDPLQTEIVMLLTSEEPAEGEPPPGPLIPGRLCLVGDPKQSIYRFRRADVANYLAVKKRLLAAGAVEVRLSTNFRSVPRITDLVNEIMEPVFESGKETELEKGSRQVDYVPLIPHRGNMESGPSLAAIPIPNTKYLRYLSENEPEAVADFVEELLASDFRVSTTDGGERALCPEDICLLFRRFRNYRRLIPQPYADALRDREIPHSLSAIESYVGSPEISFLRTALFAIEHPDDEVAVYATLRGPLFAIPDEELFLYRERQGRESLRPAWAAQKGSEAAVSPVEREILDALGFLDRLHRNRNHQPISRTMDELLAKNRAEVGFAFWKSSDQVLANLRRLVETARAFESGGRASFRAFVRRLAEEAEQPDFGAPLALDEEVGGVRLMTIHGVKGLEFPVVILCDSSFARKPRVTRAVRPEQRLYACDLGAGLKPWDLIEETAEEEAQDLLELDRLLYVAVTRARDLLAAPSTTGKFPRDSYLEPVARGLQPFLPETDSEKVKPEYRPGDVRMWDLLRQEASGTAAGEGRRLAAEFIEERKRALDSGKTPRRRVARAGAFGRSGLPVRSVAVHAVSREAHRPGGEEFGILVHRVLETVPLDAGDDDVLRTAERAVGELDLPEMLGAPAGRAAVAALRHPVLQAARAAAVCHRELPLLHVEKEAALVAEKEPGFETGSALDAEADDNGEAAAGEGPVLVDGVADLVFQERAGGPWTVVDFKTGDPEAEVTGDAYRVQVTLYARAIERATGQEAEPVLLFV